MLLLFISAFLAGTWFPISSEAVLIALIWSDHETLSILWFAATAGNVLGSSVNWTLGYFLSTRKTWLTQKLLNGTAQKRFLTYGKWSLLWAWVPLVGDSLTFVAGVFRVPLWQFILFMIVGKGGRYGVIIYFLA